MNTETQTTRDVPNAEKLPLNQRERDLLRYCRSELHQAGLITDEEYYDMLQWGSNGPGGGSPSARRLEDYDELRAKLDALTSSASQTPTDITRKPESGASGCGGAEEAKTDGEIARKAARAYCNYEANEHERYLGSEDKLTEIILAALRQKSASKEPIEK